MQVRGELERVLFATHHPQLCFGTSDCPTVERQLDLNCTLRVKIRINIGQPDVLMHCRSFAYL
jgi:hypothetical protein